MPANHRTLRSIHRAVVACVLAALLALPALACPRPAFAAYRGFTDISPNHWAVAGGVVDYALDNGLVKGTGATTLSPDAPVNRAQVACIVYNIAGSPVIGHRSSFSDDATFGYAAQAIAWCQSRGVVNGNGGKFDPWRNITRQEACAMLANYFAAGRNLAAGDLSAFADGGQVQQWARPAVSWAVDSGIVNGRERNGARYLAPRSTCTRMEFCGMAKNALTGSYPNLSGQGLQVFASSYMSKAMEELQQTYSARTGLAFADAQYWSSGELLMKLENGEAADLLFTGSRSTMDTAEEAGFVVPRTRVNLTTDLVIVANQRNAALNAGSVTLRDVATGNYWVAIGDANVPAGVTANQALSTVGCFNDPEGKAGPESSGRVDYGAEQYAPYEGTPLAGKVGLFTSVGQVLNHVESGQADVGFCYRCDALRFGGAKVLSAAPAESHSPVLMPGAVCARAQNAEAAEAFLQWCVTDAAAQAIWQKWGFAV